MSTQDILNTFLIIGLMTLIVSVIYTSYYFVKALKAIINVLNNLEDATLSIKERMQMKVLAAIPAILLTLAAKLIRKRR